MSGAIRLNTNNLREYAARIDRVNNRLVKIDARLKRLYYNVPVSELWSLIKVDAITGFSWNLRQCSGYLRETADNFEAAERELARQNDILNYQGINTSAKIFKNNSIDNKISKIIAITVGNVKSTFVNLPKNVKNAIEKEWKDFNNALDDLKDYEKKIKKNICNIGNGIFDQTQKSLAGAWNDVKSFYENHPTVRAVVDLTADGIDLVSSVHGLKEPKDFVTGFWDMVNFVPTAGADLMALAVIPIGKMTGQDDKWIKEQSDNFREIDSWADFYAYEENGYKKPDANTKKSKLVQGFERIDKANETIKFADGVSQTKDKVLKIGKNVSDLYDVKKGKTIFDIEGNIKSASDIKSEIRNGLISTFSTIKKPDDESATIKNVNTVVKNLKKAISGNEKDAVLGFVKPAKQGKDAGKVITNFIP